MTVVIKALYPLRA